MSHQFLAQSLVYPTPKGGIGQLKKVTLKTKIFVQAVWHRSHVTILWDSVLSVLDDVCLWWWSKATWHRLWKPPPPSWNRDVSFYSGQFSSVQYAIYVLRKVQRRPTPSHRSFPSIAFKTVPMFVWLTIALSRPFKEDHLALPLSTSLSSRRMCVCKRGGKRGVSIVFRFVTVFSFFF